MTSSIPQSITPTAVTLGNFDGMHLGHQDLMRTLVGYARDQKLRSVALVLWPHPREVLGGKVIPCLSKPPARMRWIRNAHVDQVHILKFSRELSQWRAETFLEALQQRMSMRVLVIGPTTHLGRGREGTPERVQEIGRKLGIRVVTLDPLRQGTQIVSSSSIREALAQGDISLAWRYLGRPMQSVGRVVRDRGVGRMLGFPTLNLARVDTALPARGVYLTLARFGQQRAFALTNVGVRPTFSEGESHVHIETHILGRFVATMTPRRLRLGWLRRLRDEQRFVDLHALTRQLQEDVAHAQRIIMEEKFLISEIIL